MCYLILRTINADHKHPSFLLSLETVNLSKSKASLDLCNCPYYSCLAKFNWQVLQILQICLSVSLSLTLLFLFKFPATEILHLRYSFSINEI